MRRALVLVAALLLPGCDRGLLDHDAVLADQNASLRIPLSVDVEGVSYALRAPTLEVSGSALLTLSSRESDRRDLTTPLPPGSYTLYLRPGYRVVRVDADGSEHAVEAQLAGANPLRFALRPLEDTTVKLPFAVGDQQIVFGLEPPLRVTRADPSL